MVFHGLPFQGRADDQFLLEIYSHQLSVQVETHAHNRVEDVLQIVRSLETAHKDRHTACARKLTTHVWFITYGRVRSPDTDHFIQQLVAELGFELGLAEECVRGVCNIDP